MMVATHAVDREVQKAQGLDPPPLVSNSVFAVLGVLLVGTVVACRACTT